VPLARYIDIEDSEAILRAIRLTSTDMPIDLIVHTPGGLVLAAEQIAHALLRHRAPVTIFVPHYAMSGGTMLALACDQIVMDPNAVLGPVDPQLGPFPAASILEVVARKPVAQVSDETLGDGDRDPHGWRHGPGTGGGAGRDAGDGYGDTRLPNHLRASQGAGATRER
jgi:ClpP class serine protease